MPSQYRSELAWKPAPTNLQKQYENIVGADSISAHKTLFSEYYVLYTNYKINKDLLTLK